MSYDAINMTLYRLLVKGGASEAEAEEAARTDPSGHDARLHKVEADLTLLKWMVGTNVALTLIILARLFTLRLAGL